jgi:putative transposase
MRYQFIREHAAQFPIAQLCDVLDVARSGYYAWLTRPESVRAQEDTRLLKQMTAIHQKSRQTYGHRRIHAELRQDGETCGKGRVSRLMRQHKLVARLRRKHRTTTDSTHQEAVAPNLLDRQFAVSAPDHVWVSDITYIATWDGWLYLATVMDLGTRQIVGWSLGTTLERSLVINALTDALQRRRPAPGLIHHSDRGSQYASRDYQQLLTDHGLIASMSRKGNCWDNAPMESFFHSLKTELVYGAVFRTHAQARREVFEYIEVWYNRQRLHSALGYLTPVQYEQRLRAA